MTIITLVSVMMGERHQASSANFATNAIDSTKETKHERTDGSCLKSEAKRWLGKPRLPEPDPKKLTSTTDAFKKATTRGEPLPPQLKVSRAALPVQSEDHKASTGAGKSAGKAKKQDEPFCG